MSYNSESLDRYETAIGSGQFVKDVEAVDHQQNPAAMMVLRAITRAAELGDLPEDKISQTVERVGNVLFSHDNSVDSHSDSHEAGQSLGGWSVSFLDSWRLSIDCYAPSAEWPIASLDMVEKIEFAIYPQIDDADDVGPPYLNDLFCDFMMSATFVYSVGNRWAYSPIDSTLELPDQANILEFVTGLEAGLPPAKDIKFL